MGRNVGSLSLLDLLEVLLEFGVRSVVMSRLSVLSWMWNVGLRVVVGMVEVVEYVSCAGADAAESVSAVADGACAGAMVERWTSTFRIECPPTRGFRST